MYLQGKEREVNSMGWNNDYSFEYLKKQANKKQEILTCNKILGYIKKNPNITIEELRQMIIELKKSC